MKDGAILSNSGHFNVEIDIPALEPQHRPASDSGFGGRIHPENGTCLYVLAEGPAWSTWPRPKAPSAVMDMSFANQALSAEFICQNHQKFAKAGLSGAGRYR